jgi:hypothetical protein
MAWIYLAESAASQSPSTNGLDPSPTARSIPIVKESCCQECTDYLFPKPLYGTTSKHSIRYSTYPLILTSFTEGFPARISALQDLEKAWKESEVGYFIRSYHWPKRSSPVLYSLKMFPQYAPEAAFLSSNRLPRWGMIVDGALYPLRPLEQYTKEIDGSVWLGTPMASESTTGRSKKFLSPNKKPTPQEFISIPTPCARDARIGKRKDKSKLRKSQLCEWIGIQRESDYGKKLAPQWIEQLMGYPKGWTELEPWAMQWLQLKRKKRSKS